MSWQKNTSTFSFFLQTFLLQCTKWNLIGWCEAAGNCIILPLNFQQRKLSRCVSVQSRRLMQRLQTRDVWRNPQSWVFITKKDTPFPPLLHIRHFFSQETPPEMHLRVRLLLISQTEFILSTESFSSLHSQLQTSACRRCNRCLCLHSKCFCWCQKLVMWHETTNKTNQDNKNEH